MKAFGSIQVPVIRSQKGFFLSVYVLLHLLRSEVLAELQNPIRPSSSCNIQNKCENSGFFDKHAEGWHWYEYQEPESKNKKLEKKEQKDPPQSPTQVIEDQRKELEQKLHAAIVEPNRENIISYILAQRALMDQSQKFSESWKKVVMTTPSLDESLIHPVDQNARHIYYREKSEDLKDRIKKLASEYGLFFFFRKECSYCHGFAPIVKSFAKTYGWSVLPISLDGGILPEFPNARRDNGIAERLQITHVPALIALHPKSGKLIPLAYGMVSISEIEERVDLLTRISDELSNGENK